MSRNLRDKAFFYRFPDISDADRTDIGILMQTSVSFLFQIQLVIYGGLSKWNKDERRREKNYLDNLRNSNRLADCLSHGLQNNLFYSPLLVIKEKGKLY